jgi:hypothetical protein
VALALVVVLAALVSASAASSSAASGFPEASSCSTSFLVGAAPVSDHQLSVRSSLIDLQTVLGAVCVYVLIGMMTWSFAFTALGTFDSQRLLRFANHATVAD